MATYNYPHVDITTKALTRRTPSVAESTATTLLAPFVCDRGPENELVDIDSMADFIATYGNLDYSKPGQRQILNIGNWLSAGGRVKALRYTEASYSEPQLVIADEANGQSGVNTLNFAYDGDKDKTSIVAISYTPASGTTTDYISIIVNDSTGSSTYLYPLHYAGEKTAEGSDATYTSPSVAGSTSYDSFYANALSKDAFVTSEGNIRTDVSATLTYTGLDESVADCTNAILNISSHGETLKTNITVHRDVKGEGFAAKKAAAGYAISKYSDNGTVLGLVGATAKYSGSYYNGITVKITTTGTEGAWRFSVVLSVGSTVIEKFQKLTVEKLYTVEENSEYLGDFSIKAYESKSAATEEADKYADIMEIDESEYKDLLNQMLDSGTITLTLGSTNAAGYESVKGASISATDTDKRYYDTALIPSMKIALAQPLESEFDVMLDCGYPESVKQDLIALFSAKEDNLTKLTRDDAFLYLTPYVITGNGRKDVPSNVDIDELINKAGASTDDMAFNVGVYTHYGKVIDLYSEDSGKEVYVPATYELAGKIPAIDASYGVQYPVAGLTRGKLSDFTWIDSVPSNSEKNSYYEGRVNYIEKDSRGMYFMCQLTKADGDTALKFINNSRALLKMKKELRKIARNYLHEFNDRITKNNLLNALNTSLANWINNRTLSYGSISLQDYTENDTLSNEELLIQLDVKFTGTIEVISIDITVE